MLLTEPQLFQGKGVDIRTCLSLHKWDGHDGGDIVASMHWCINVSKLHILFVTDVYVYVHFGGYVN